MTTFGTAIEDALAKRDMSIVELASRADVPLVELTSAVERKSELEDDALIRVAEELAIPIRALFTNAALPLSVVPDFRRSSPKPGLYHSGTLKALAFVEKISGTLSQLPLELGLSERLAFYDGPLKKPDAKSLAKIWRKEWGITNQQQLDWKSSHAVYNSLRDFIESLGIFVVHRSFGTDEVAGVYTKIDSGPDVIIINTTSSSKARKLFTLAHEFCHVLLQRTGASNPSILKNQVERFCNSFAAYLLAPDDLIDDALRQFNYPGGLERNALRLFASKLGISQHATALRLVEIGQVSQAQYGAWQNLFDGPTPPGDLTDGQGGGNGDPIRNKRTQYGSSLLSALSTALRQDFLDEIDVYKLSGIKPKYQQSLFEV